MKSVLLIRHADLVKEEESTISYLKAIRARKQAQGESPVMLTHRIACHERILKLLKAAKGQYSQMDLISVNAELNKR